MTVAKETPSLNRALEISEKNAARAAKQKSEKEAAEKAASELAPVQLLLLPLLQPDERGMPNALARGALFNAVKAGEKRQYFNNKVVASLSNITIEYEGPELRQDDCSVFLALLHFQQAIPLGEPLYFTAYAMLKELGWSHNKVEYEHLRTCCKRISATNITISNKDGTAGYAGSLLRKFAWKDDGSNTMSRWLAQFEPAIARFFQADSFSIIDPEIRRQISGRAPLAQWLHVFLNSHRDPLPMSVAKYAELTASRGKSMADFKSRLKNALQRCVDKKFLKRFTIKDDIVYVERVPVSHAMPVYRQPIDALEFCQ